MAKLVAIGDSLTQGFQSLAITHTRLSYPALIAERMGLAPDAFRLPNFMGSGGLPCSVEWLARRLEDVYGSDLNAFEWLRALHRIPTLLDEVEEYWERGRGAEPTADVDYHNLAVWGFEVADAFQIDAGMCWKAISQGLGDDLFGLPSEPRLRTAHRVLNPSHSKDRHGDTQISIAQRIKDRDGSIDHLIVALGANNCLGTVVDLDVNETGDVPPAPNSTHTLWSKKAFDLDYERLAQKVSAIGAKHTYLATIPHVTIPPITRGVMKGCGVLPSDRKYFDYYTRFFIRDKDFDADRDPHLLGEQARMIDERIDHYNATIRRVAKECKFTVVDMCDLLDGLAVRRNHGNPPRPLPPAISDLSVRFLEIAPNGTLRNGGLISLDGVHPTACGYGLVAQLFIDAMKPFEPTLRDVDFTALRTWDTLVSTPPRTLDDVFGALQLLERHFHLSKWLSKGALRKR